MRAVCRQLGVGGLRVGRAKVSDLIDPLLLDAPPSLQVRARLGTAARARLRFELQLGRERTFSSSELHWH